MRRFFFALFSVAMLFFVSISITSCQEEDLILNSSLDTNIPISPTQANALIGSSGRIAVSADGNDHDRDDIGATPLSLAIIAHAGLKGRLVHYDYNSHIWGNASSSQKQDMTESTLGAASRFGFDKSIFISAIDNKSKAEQSITNAINKSSSSNPLYIVLAGPAAIICRGINSSDPAKRKYVTVVSHHVNNEDHTHDTKNACVGDDIRQSGVNFVRISNQNNNLKTKDWSEYSWLKNHKNANLRWVYERMKKAFGYKADVSDAGMVWYVLKNDQKGSPSKLKSFFSNSPATSDPEPQPEEPQPNPSAEVHAIPGQIEAEAYATMSGIRTETTSDTGGGENIGYIKNGDYADYQVKVATTGTYKVAFRVASDAGEGSISLKKGSTTLGKVGVSNTGGWQSWKTISTNVKLSSGSQTLRLQFSGGSSYLFNLNYIKFTSDTGGSDEPTSEPTNGTSTITLKPIADAFTSNGTGYNTNELRTEKGKRISYLMFDLSSVSAPITKAQLKLSVDSDPGDGTIQIWQGSHNSWTESNLSSGNAPSANSKMGSLSGEFSSGNTYAFNLVGLKKGSKVTLVVLHTSGNDVAFASSESSKTKIRPSLIITTD